MIGTLNESPLHQALKMHYLEHYTGGCGALEAPVGSYVADVLCGRDIYEIQTGSLGAMRSKLQALLPDYRVVVVLPVAVRSTIIKLASDSDGELDGTFTKRRSPKRGTILNLLDELVSVPHLLNHANFIVDVALIEQEQLRSFCPKARRGRGGWRTIERRLLAVQAIHRFASAADLWDLLETPPAEPFGTAELADALGAPRDTAQKLAYCLRGAEQIEQVGKKGNALLYCRAHPQEPA